MSVHVTSPVWKHSTAKGTRLLVQLSLAEQANDEGWCWPAQGSIVERTRTSRSTVQRALDWLEEHYEIEVHPRVGTSNMYRVTPAGVGNAMVPQADASAPSGGTPHIEAGSRQPDEAGGRVSIVEQGRVTSDAQTVTDPSGRTVTEPLADESRSLLPDIGGVCSTVGCSYPARHGGAHRDPWFDAVVDAFQYRVVDPEDASFIAKIANKAKTAGYTPEEIKDAAAWIVTAWGPSKLTLGSLNTHLHRALSGVAKLTDDDVTAFTDNRQRMNRADEILALETPPAIEQTGT